MKIGDKVVKKSGKPFKSTFKIETIKGFTINESDPKKQKAAILEDDSVVSLDKLKIYTGV